MAGIWGLNTGEAWFVFALAMFGYLILFISLLRPGKDKAPMDAIVKWLPETQQMRTRVIVGLAALFGIIAYAWVWLVLLGLWDEAIVQNTLFLGAIYVVATGIAGAHYYSKVSATLDLLWSNPFQPRHLITLRHEMLGWAETGTVVDFRLRDTVLSNGEGDVITVFNEDVLKCTIINHSMAPFRYHTVEVPMKPDAEDLNYWAEQIETLIIGRWNAAHEFSAEPRAGTHVVHPLSFSDTDEAWLTNHQLVHMSHEEAVKPQIRYRLDGSQLIAVITAPVRTKRRGELFESELLKALSSGEKVFPIAVPPLQVTQ